MVSIKVTPKKMHWPIVTITHGHALQHNEHMDTSWQMDTNCNTWARTPANGHAVAGAALKPTCHH